MTILINRVLNCVIHLTFVLYFSHNVTFTITNHILSRITSSYESRLFLSSYLVTSNFPIRFALGFPFLVQEKTNSNKKKTIFHSEASQLIYNPPTKLCWKRRIRITTKENEDVYFFSFHAIFCIKSLKNSVRAKGLLSTIVCVRD